MKTQRDTIKLGKKKVNLMDLTGFIVKAKKNCYAGGGEKKILEDGSTLLTFQEGNFYYEDNYDGQIMAPGREIVRWKKPQGQRLWQMAYSGGIYRSYWIDEELVEKTFTFLKEQLSKVSFDSPFRGLENERQFGEVGGIAFGYECHTEGDISTFKGREHIWAIKEGDIFTQNYNGGLVIPKIEK